MTSAHPAPNQQKLQFRKALQTNKPASTYTTMCVTNFLHTDQTVKMLHMPNILIWTSQEGAVLCL